MHLNLSIVSDFSSVIFIITSNISHITLLSHVFHLASQITNHRAELFLKTVFHRFIFISPAYQTRCVLEHHTGRIRQPSRFDSREQPERKILILIPSGC